MRIPRRRWWAGYDMRLRDHGVVRLIEFKANLMKTQTEKEVAREFLVAMFARDADRVASIMSDDATYWIGGKHERFRGIRSKRTWCQYLRAPAKFREELKLTIKCMAVEQNTVFVEAESYGVINQSEEIYNNTYVFIIIVKGGKVSEIREYMDTDHVNSVLPPS